jgi:hypothetical protein
MAKQAHEIPSDNVLELANKIENYLMDFTAVGGGYTNAEVALATGVALYRLGFAKATMA